MEADKCISTSRAATVKNQLTINDLDDYSLGFIFNKLPYIDRTRIESVCQRWYAVSGDNWRTYSNHLTIVEDFLPPYGNTTKKENILEKILQCSGPYLEEIIFEWNDSWKFTEGTVKWIIELCPKLKRLSTGILNLNKEDWLVCSKLEALCFSNLSAKLKDEDVLGLLFRNNNRLRQLHIRHCVWLTASDFDHLNPGQLEFLLIEFCANFQFTAEVADKLVESLVELRHGSIYRFTPTFQHLGRLKNLRSLDLTVEMEWYKIEIIANIANHFRKLECLFLAISVKRQYYQNVFAPLLELPYLRRLVLIVKENEISLQERAKLIRRASHLDYFAINTCHKCKLESIFLMSATDIPEV